MLTAMREAPALCTTFQPAMRASKISPRSRCGKRERINVRNLVSSRVTRRGEKRVLPQPPWVWGPTEVNEWIRSAYPSNRRRARSVRKGPSIITRLRLTVEGSDTRHVRTATAEALNSIGSAMAASPTGQARRRVVVAFRQSLMDRRIFVSLRFKPPIHASSCRRIVERLGGQVRVLSMSVREGRARLPPKSK